LRFAQAQAFSVVKYVNMPDITNESLTELLLEWRSAYAYEIDGLICMNDAKYPRQHGNPDHAFAFKMVMTGQMAEAHVSNVIWTPSKDGYLKPRVQFKPIKLGGVVIEYATGFNAKFIEENKIGVGALIRLVRSGDVIPHIVAVIQPAQQAQMPTVPYEWNATHVDILLIDKDSDVTVREKNLVLFFTSLDVEGLGAGNVKKIMAAGFETIPQILAMTTADFLKVAGFKEKMAAKIKESLAEQIQKASLPEIMSATNIFGRGFGGRKIKSILLAEPTILEPERSAAEKIQRISTVEGMSKKTAEQFVKQIPVFLEFLAAAKLTYKLQAPAQTAAQAPAAQAPAQTAAQAHPLFGKHYVMTGFRDKALIEKLTKVGAEQSASVRKNTFVVLAKDPTSTSGKVQEARALGIPIMTAEAFNKLI
jgi:NAD-dependent DNA ligase